jgi:CheY-like chemotaxis protein
MPSASDLSATCTTGPSNALPPSRSSWPCSRHCLARIPRRESSSSRPRTTSRILSTSYVNWRKGFTPQSSPTTGGSIEIVKRVLIVDDHDAFRATARRLLIAGGFDVVGEAADGAQALEAVARLRPDVVLLDVQLPDSNGFEIAARLSSNSHHPDIVLTSSREAAEFGGLIERSSARGFIPKAKLSGKRLAALLG